MALRNALVLGCNGILGKSIVGKLGGEGWRIVGADVFNPGSIPKSTDDFEVIALKNDSARWAEEVAETVEMLPELDLVVT